LAIWLEDKLLTELRQKTDNYSFVIFIFWGELCNFITITNLVVIISCSHFRKTKTYS